MYLEQDGDLTVKGDRRFIKKYNQHTNTQQRLEWSPVQRDADVWLSSAQIASE